MICMIHKSILTAVGLLTASIFPTSVAAASRFTIEDGNFMLDGAPYLITLRKNKIESKT